MQKNGQSKQSMKLLVNCDKLFLETKFDITVLKQLEYLKIIHNDTFYCGNGWNDDLDTAVTKYRPNVILFAADFSFNDWILAPKYKNIKKIMYMQDYWDDIDRRIEILDYGNFDALITKNNTGTELYKEKFPQLKFFINASGFDNNIFYPTYVDKEHDILLCGILDEYRYPQRFRLANISKKLKDDIKVYTKPHCRWYKHLNDDPLERGQSTFAEYINKSKLVISGTALMGLYMQKTWEISACSSICVTDLNTNEPEYNLLKNHVKQIDLKLSDNDIADILLYEVKNFNYDITKKYNRVVNSYANLYHRTNQLFEIIRGLI